MMAEQFSLGGSRPERPMGVSRRQFMRLSGAAGLALAGNVALRRATTAAQATPPAGGTPVGSAGKVTIYSGRNENLIGDLVTQFEQATGIDAEVRYGDTAELAATILEEGDNSPADLFWAQDAGALGALAKEERLVTLPDSVLDLVDTRFRSSQGVWVGTSGRARVLVYNTEQLTEADLPTSVLDLVDSKWKGKIGWAPTNASFQSFVTALRVVQGEDGAREWLEGILANDPVVFEGNSAIVRAVGAGEIAVGLVNHYYLYEIREEEGEDFPAANHFFAAGDVGNLVNVAGVGILRTASNAEQAQRFVEYLLGQDGQTYFAERTFEYPLVEGVEPGAELVPLDEIKGPEIDLGDLADLQGTLQLLTEVGVL
jgi:iron(III) transport system substrate-binding protein